MNKVKYQPVIGLEVHIELKTKSKMFCGCEAKHFGVKPNTQVCPVCLGLPGALPVPNKKAIEWCVMIGLALNCKIPLLSKFDRKNYFYPDLPKGYQISQYDEPFSVNGWVDINSLSVILGNEATPESPSLKVIRDSGRVLLRRGSGSLARMTKKRIRIRRVHMEEDTAKLIHQFGTQNSSVRQAQDDPESIEESKLKTQNFDKGYSLIDFNRSGVPLVEIVTEPDFESATEVVEYLKKLQQIVRYLGLSHADMEKGYMRLEPNISLKHVILGTPAQRDDSRISKAQRDSGRALLRRGSGSLARITKEGLPKYKVEVKNINSFKFVEKAINYEIERQKKILESGKTPLQETRGWDEKREITVSQRVKEESMDYRYFPEPDIPPIRWSQSQISNLKSQIPELPDKKRKRFQKDYGLSIYDCEILTREKAIADYFEETVKVNHELSIRRPELMPKGIMNKESINTKVIANWIINKKVDTNTVLPAQLIKLIMTSGQTIAIDTQKLEEIVKDVLQENQKAVLDYKKGKTQVIGFLIGQILQKMRQPLNTVQIKETIEKLLKIN